MNYVEHQTVIFKRKNHIRKCNFKKLLQVCHKHEYIVKSYSNGKNFMLASGVWRKAQSVPSISIVDEYGNTMIFLRDDLSPEKRLFALAHELGHITLKHKDPENDEAENEANEFAHLLLDCWDLKRIERFVPITILLVCAIAFLIIYDISKSHIIKTQQSVDTIYYVRDGEVYHLYKDCFYLKNSKRIMSGTIEFCKKDRCCSACEKRVYNEIK